MIISETAVQALLWNACPLYKHAGLVVESVRDGIYRCRVPLTSQNSNHLNTVHAALQWAAAEVPGGLVAVGIFDPEQFAKIFVAVRSVSIEFLRPARTAITAEAVLGEPETMEIKRFIAAGEDAVFRLHTVVRSESGETVATADAEYVIRPRRADRQGLGAWVSPKKKAGAPRSVNRLSLDRPLLTRLSSVIAAASLCGVLLAGCGNSTTSGNSGTSASHTSANIDRSCDLAPFPSAQWTQCEATNFAKQSEAPAEQLTPAFQQRLLTQSQTNFTELLARAAADPSWVGLPSGNTLAVPYCGPGAFSCVGDPFRYPQAVGPDGDAFYTKEADVIPVVFYDRDCARLAGRVWAPKGSPAPAALPTVVIANGSLGASEQPYWWAAQALVRNGYAVLTYDPRGQGRSDFLAPDGQLGTNANAKIFWEDLVDAIDFLHSTPQRPHPHDQTCAGRYPTAMTAFNPIWNRIDRDRLGIAGHSLGAIAVSVVQGYGAPGADPWPGKLDASNPVKAAVAWDSLITPDGRGFAPAQNAPLPPDLVALLLQVGTQGNLPKFGPRAPTLSFDADYGLFDPLPYVAPPDSGKHKLAFAEWQQAQVPIYGLTFQGTTHTDYSLLPPLPTTSWCPDTSTGACRGGYGLPAIVHYTLAWFDRWLKKPGEPGYADADARLLDDGGANGAVKMSFRYRSARTFPDRSGRQHHCEDIRGGCGE